MTPEQKAALAAARARMAGSAGPTVAAQDAALDPERQAFMAARARGEFPDPVPVSEEAAARADAMSAAAMPGIRAAGYGERQPVGQGAAALLGAGQGMTMNASDEIIAGMVAPFTSRTYGQELENVRGRLGVAQEQNPWTYGGAQVVGAAGAGLTGLGAARALGVAAPTTALGVAGEGAALGAAEGALAGFGGGEGTGDRLQDMLLYGAMGGAIGGAAPSVVSGVRKGTDALLGGPIDAARGFVTGTPNVGRASDAVARTVERAGMTPDDVTVALEAAMREGQPEFMLADALGAAGQRKLAGVAIATPDARPAIANALLERQAGQSGRVGRFIQEGLGVTDTAAQRTAALTADRKEAADLAYEAARAGAGPVNLNGTLETIDALLRRDPILGETALSQGPIGTRLNALRNRMQAGGEQLIDFDSVLNIKSDLGEQIGRGRGGPEIGQTYRALDEALENSSQGYRAANDGYRTASGMIDAVPAGAANARPTVRAADTVGQYAGLPAEQQAPFRTGFADPILARIENQPPGVNSVRALTGDGTVAKLDAMANDPALLQRRLGREDAMFGTQQAALGGSQTALNQVDAGDSNAGAALVGMMTAPRATILQGIGRGIGNAVTGQSATTRAEIARMLMSRDVQAALAPAMRADQRIGAQNRTVEALLRALVRPTQ